MGFIFAVFIINNNTYEPKYNDHVCITGGFYEGQEATIYAKAQSYLFMGRNQYFITLDGHQVIEFDTINKRDMKECK